LKIEKEYLEDHQVKVTAAIEQDVMERFMRRAARAISKDHKIPGFRPGKAPYDVVKRNFGEEAIERQAIELMLDDIYPQVLEEAEINPSGPGSLDNIVSHTPPVFEFIIPLMPDVELGDYSSIRFDYQLEPVTDQDVDEVLKNLRTSYATAVPVERAAQEGDLVSFKIKGVLAKPEEGEETEIVKEFSNQLQLEDTDQENPWPFDGFWKELLDLSKGDTKSVKHSYSEDTPFSNFSGKEIEFNFTIEGVKEMEYPEMDDDFAKTLGDYETMDDLKAAILENLKSNRQQEYEQDYLSKVVDSVVELSTIKYAPNTLQEEIDHVLANVQQDLANQNLDLETYLKFRDTDQDTFIEEELKPIAIRRLERSLVLDSVTRQEGIEIQEEELKAGVTETISQLFSTPEFKKPTTNQDMRKLTNVVSYDTASRILNQKVQDRLMKIAKGETDSEAEAAVETKDDVADLSDAPEAETVVEPVPEDENIKPAENDAEVTTDVSVETEESDDSSQVIEEPDPAESKSEE